jgi:predicted ATPase
VTLTGPGGAGKTRLALEIATRLAGQFRDGTWLVELAGLRLDGHVDQSVAAELGLAAHGWTTDALVAALRERVLLIVLDNCEHLVPACASLARQLLHDCPDIHIIATSRHRLGVSGELVWHLPGLAFPGTRETWHTIDELARFEAVRLFVDRARLVQPGFALSTQNAAFVAEICRQLDGMPLAIELAADRLTVLTPKQITEHMDKRFRLLTAGTSAELSHHKTLEASVEWSYSLLSEPQATLLRQLAVFAGNWSLAAADAVCKVENCDDFCLLDSLSLLVDHSLVEAEERGVEARYRLLETVRSYALEKLDAREASEARDRHFAFFAALAQEVEQGMRDPGRSGRPERLEQASANLQAGLEWALSQPRLHADGLRLGLCLQRLSQGHAPPAAEPDSV